MTGSPVGTAPGVRAGVPAPGRAPLDLTPRPGGATRVRTVAAHAAMETRLLVRNPEQLLVAVVIPVLALLVLDRTALLDSSLPPGQPRTALSLPGVLALAVLSTAFTSTAITTGFDRRYGVLRRLGATPLGRGGLVGGKTLAVLAVLAGQTVVLVVVAAALGWRLPAGAHPAAAAGLLVLGVAALVPVALLVGGTLRAEASLAVANIVYVVLLGLSAVLVPADRYPAGVAAVARLLPSGALAGGLRAVLAPGAGGGAAGPVLVLVAWSVLASAACVRWFRWD